MLAAADQPCRCCGCTSRLPCLQDPARGALALPGAVEDLDAPPLFKGAGGGSDSAASGGGEGKGSAAAGEGAAAQGASEGGSESQATTNTAADGSLVSDYGRGKRLRKLIRLLSSKAAMQVVVGFRYKVILLVAVMFIVHMGAFGALVGFLGKQATYLDEMEAAGEVVDLVHRIASLSVVLEAAQRGYGLAAGDIATYAAEMEINYNRWAVERWMFCEVHARCMQSHTQLCNSSTPSLSDHPSV